MIEDWLVFQVIRHRHRLRLNIASEAGEGQVKLKS